MDDAARRLPVVIRPIVVTPEVLARLVAETPAWPAYGSYDHGPCAPTRGAVMAGAIRHRLDIVV